MLPEEHDIVSLFAIQDNRPATVCPMMHSDIIPLARQCKCCLQIQFFL